jgi:hypothetical protein
MNHEDIRPESGAAAGIGVELDLGFAVASLGKKVDSLVDYWERNSEIVYQVPLYAQITGTTPASNPDGPNDGANTGNSSLQANGGHCWSIRRMTVSGYTAGTVTAYINGLEPVASWTFGQTTPPFYQYPKGALLLQPGDKLTIGAVGVTGTAQLFGMSDAFPYWYLRKYLD